MSVTVHGDAIDEPDEWLAVLFGNASNATIGGFYGIGFGIIVDDDPPPQVTPGAVADQSRRGQWVDDLEPAGHLVEPVGVPGDDRLVHRGRAHQPERGPSG